MINVNAAIEDILSLFAAEGLHTDLSVDDLVALASEIANLERLGHVVDLRTGQILEDVSPDAPVMLQANTAVHAGDWN